MAVLDFQSEALVRLRTRVAALGEANSDLLAYARGHAGAVQQIHAAALAAMDATDFEHLIHVVTQDWVDILRIDAVGLGLTTSGQGIRASASGVQFVDPEQVELWCHLLPVGQARSVKHGSPVFGPAADLIRSEALIALKPTPPAPTGIIALGSRAPHNFGDYHGNELLAFLGDVVSRMIARWMQIEP
ncbi:DUF484 family protein [Sphingosinicella sp.]|jgi:uncharacterized protein YigA (DUF484 family)|uniref:DUF484 family protein n=1 Tax=Sphingosinicella sp. TaxID=1917971 RepID=UPI00179242D9|nr:DUF484 family protein [Sphingosinicella sp.]MBA4759817.1 DUF484 family protein [Sphingosinicella sp.]MEA3539115.1 DUF484 family protein [Pseudomonadota bacterium]